MKYLILATIALFGVGFYSCDQNSNETTRKSKQLAADKEENEHKNPESIEEGNFAVDQYAIKLNWQEVSGKDVTSYRVYFIGRSEEDKEFDLISTIKVSDLDDAHVPEAIINLTSFLKNADSKNEYCFAITALSESGESSYSRSKCLFLKNNLEG